ncbi:MAG: adenine phosphoribosyltransferase [Opitutales bacterium]
MSADTFKQAIRTVPNFPKPGINFRDISPLVREPATFRRAVEAFAEIASDGLYRALAGVDARGFIFAGAVANELSLPLVMIRKKGKLPPDTISVDYELEYGHASVEAARDSELEGVRCLIVDDLLATGGTALAAAQLLRELGAKSVGFAALINLSDLPGETRLREAGVDVHSLCSFTEDE